MGVEPTRLGSCLQALARGVVRGEQMARLYVCPRTTICVLILLHVCTHTYYYRCGLILLYMCPHADTTCSCLRALARGVVGCERLARALLHTTLQHFYTSKALLY